MSAFIKRWNLSDTLLSTLKKSCNFIYDPAIICNVNDIPDKKISQHEFRAHPKSFWNVDKNDHSIEAQKRKVAN